MVVVDYKQLETLVTRMIQMAGSGIEEAETVAFNLVEANLMGHDSHGVGLAPMIPQHLVSPGACAGAMLSASPCHPLGPGPGQGRRPQKP